jgi:GNAT superfamily N-acetyltransferase
MAETNGTNGIANGFYGTANGNAVPSNLPDGKSETLALVHPTEEEKLKQFKSNGVFWRGALSMEAYLRREEFLANQEWTKDGGITYWALVDTAAKERLVLSGCESFRKRALLSIDGKVEDVLCHGIGSVFCPPELRRRGYAARMMKELGEKLKTWQGDEKGSLFSILYSDIGKVPT